MKELSVTPTKLFVLGLLAGTVHAVPVIEETFETYPAGGANLAGNNGGIGFTGAWVNTRNSPDVGDSTQDLGGGNMFGDAVGNFAFGNAWSGVARPIGSTLDTAGLLDNGTTLWFGAQLALVGQNTSNADINIALTNAAKFVSGTFGDRENLDQDNVEGIGITHSRANIEGVYWRDDGTVDNVSRRTENDSALTINGTSPNPIYALIVGKIEWGADDLTNETLTLYYPDGAGGLSTPIMDPWSIPALDQKTFDTLAIQFKDRSQVDEIRFGSGSADVLIPEDTTAPDPDPMTWASVPAADSASAISMTATGATDDSGVEYYFAETSGNTGGDDSGWRDSASYTDIGLDAATTYTYTVKARDKSPAQNETGASAAESATTDSADMVAPDPDPMTWAVLPAADSASAISMTATGATDASGVEYYFTETSGNTGGDDSGWQDSASYTDSGLDAATTYTYTVKARDKSPAQNETAASAAESATTDAPDGTAPDPDPMTWAAVPAATSTSVTMTASTATDDSGVEYYFAETSGNPGGDDSGWQDSASYTDNGLDPLTTYTYTAKARDKSPAQNETAASSAESATTTAPVIAGLEIYEGFDYEIGAINGLDGGTGFAGAWASTRNNPTAAEPGFEWGDLTVTGNFAQGNAWSGLQRPIGSTSSLDMAGLMDDGATLWFSVIMDLTGQNTSNADLNLSLGTGQFYAGDFGRRELLQGDTAEGIGVTHSGGRIQGVYWQDNGTVNDAAERTENNSSLFINGAGDNLTTALIVGKIEWGADNSADETLTLYAPDSETLALGDPIMDPWTIPALNQADFDTVALQFKDTSKFDEIRFGASFEDVAPLPADTSVVITSITAIGGGVWELTLLGEAATGYEFVSSPGLEFNPGVVVENLTAGGVPVGTIGGTNDSVLTTDGDGNGTVRMTLSSPRDFVRAQIPPPQTLFSEDFDTTLAGSLPAGWAAGKNAADNSSLTNWELGTPANVGPVPPGVPLPSATNCVATNISGNYDDPVSDLGVAHSDIWLRSSSIDLGAATEGTLSFQQWTQIEDVPGDLDYGSIRILDADDDSELVVMESQSIDGSTSGWEEYSMALPAEAFTATAGTIKVEFRFEADDIDSLAGWYIDDVTVTTPGS